jgi:hypothetical protein
VGCFSANVNRNISFPTSAVKELTTCSSKADISSKPSIYALKNEEPKKSKRPVSAYVTSQQRRCHNVSS